MAVCYFPSDKLKCTVAISHHIAQQHARARRDFDARARAEVKEIFRMSSPYDPNNPHDPYDPATGRDDRRPDAARRRRRAGGMPTANACLLGARHRLAHPESLSSIGRDISRTIERAISAKDDYVVAVKVSHEAQEKLENLVQAGVFRSRAEAAAFLIDEGIKSQTALFDRVQQKLHEIERLRAELRGMINHAAELRPGARA
jgi:Arc/MetJ-type ribon-helix-helix transcriptional regulator